MNCDAVERLLGAWWDGELGNDEAEAVRKHLELCPSCRSARARLERLDSSIRGALWEKADEIRFEPFWAGIERRIEAKKPWGSRLADWGDLLPGMRRLGWAVSLAVLLAIGFFSFSDLYRGWFFGSNGVRTRIESIDAHGFNVAVFREARTRTTVIWLFQDQEGDDEAQEEADSENHSL